MNSKGWAPHPQPPCSHHSPSLLVWGGYNLGDLQSLCSDSLIIFVKVTPSLRPVFGLQGCSPGEPGCSCRIGAKEPGVRILIHVCLFVSMSLALLHRFHSSSFQKPPLARNPQLICPQGPPGLALEAAGGLAPPASSRSTDFFGCPSAAFLNPLCPLSPSWETPQPLQTPCLSTHHLHP